MGTLVDGQWQSEQLFPTDKKGSFIRKDSVFQQSVSNTDPVYKPESNRYHLYVSYACPWAHRTLIMRSLKSLDAHIGTSVVCPDMLENGWTFSTKHPDTTGDRLYQHRYLYQVYQQAKKNLNTRVTVPVLWDKQTKTIVNNESSQIIRIFNSEFNTLTGNDHNYYPDALKKSIDQWNQQNYDAINNGVYKAGFAVTQSAYDDAVEKIYTQLDRCDSHLQDHHYLCGSTFTEADIRLIPTLLRFDLVYHTHFKCTVKRIIDYKGLSAYLNRCRSIAAVAKTTNDWHIKRHYYYSHRHINPYQIIPKSLEKY